MGYVPSKQQANQNDIGSVNLLVSAKSGCKVRHRSPAQSYRLKIKLTR